MIPAFKKIQTGFSLNIVLKEKSVFLPATSCDDIRRLTNCGTHCGTAQTITLLLLISTRSGQGRSVKSGLGDIIRILLCCWNSLNFTPFTSVFHLGEARRSVGPAQRSGAASFAHQAVSAFTREAQHTERFSCKGPRPWEGERFAECEFVRQSGAMAAHVGRGLIP